MPLINAWQCTLLADIMCPGKGIAALADELKGYIALGYNAVKIKIGGAPLAEDMKRIEAAIGVVGRADRLAVDANGRFDLKTALAYAEALAPLGLRWYEEAGDPLDYQLQAVLAEHYPARSPPARISSRPRKPAISCATAACAAIGIFCNLIARYPTGFPTICARSTSCAITAGPGAASTRMAATRCR